MSMCIVFVVNDFVIELCVDLIGVFVKGEKLKDVWWIGIEYEKFVYFFVDYCVLSYEEKGGIYVLMIGLICYGWELVYEGENIIVLLGVDGSVSFEFVG